MTHYIGELLADWSSWSRGVLSLIAIFDISDTEVEGNSQINEIVHGCMVIKTRPWWGTGVLNVGPSILDRCESRDRYFHGNTSVFSVTGI